MIKLFSEIIGSKVILFQERLEIGSVESLILDVKERSFPGFFVHIPFERTTKVVPIGEVKAVGDEFILIRDLNSVSEVEEIVKIKEALKINPKILGQKVETESGQVLGRVSEATLRLNDFSLDRLYVNPFYKIKFLAKQLVIKEKQIVEIKKDKIIVVDELSKHAQKTTAFAAICPE